MGCHASAFRKESIVNSHVVATCRAEKADHDAINRKYNRACGNVAYYESTCPKPLNAV